jgi:hypothetical protein
MTKISNEIALSSKQIQAANMMVNGKRSVEIAQALEVSPVTICNWRKLPKFQAYRDKYLQELSSHQKRRAMGMVDCAVDALYEVLAAGSDKDRLSAAKTIFELNDGLSPKASDINVSRKKTFYVAIWRSTLLKKIKCGGGKTNPHANAKY